MKVKNVSRSAKVRVNVQTFRDCALHQWNVVMNVCTVMLSKTSTPLCASSPCSLFWILYLLTINENYNRTYNKILNCDWFSMHLSVMQLAHNHKGVQ